MVLPVWLKGLWESTLSDLQLLHSVQELAVIKKIIDKSGPLPATMVSSMRVARLVQKAYAMVEMYGIPTSREYYLFSQECEASIAWRSEIDTYLHETDRIMRCHLPAKLHSLIRSLTLAERIYLTPGLALTLAERNLLSVFAGLGVDVVEVDRCAEAAAKPRLVAPQSWAD